MYVNSLIYGIEYNDIELDENYREELMNIAETEERIKKLIWASKKNRWKSYGKNKLKW